MAGVTPPTLPARNANARVGEIIRYFGRFQDGCAIRGSQFLPKLPPCAESGPNHTAFASSGTCRRSDLSGNSCEGAKLVLSEIKEPYVPLIPQYEPWKGTGTCPRWLRWTRNPLQASFSSNSNPRAGSWSDKPDRARPWPHWKFYKGE